METLRKELAVAQEAVAQATARSAQLESDMEARVQALEEQANAAVEEQRQVRRVLVGEGWLGEGGLRGWEKKMMGLWGG